MSYKWPNKDKDEIADYSVDWSRFLGTDTLAAATWFIEDENGDKVLVDDAEVVNGLQFVASTISGKVATIRLSLGTNNIKYSITCRINTGNGLQYERTVFLSVKEK